MKLPDPQACWLACGKGNRRKPQQPSAHGEVPAEAFSDGGPTPPASTKKDKQAETSLFVSFYPTNNRTNAVLERIYKEIRSIIILKANPKQSAENIRH